MVSQDQSLYYLDRYIKQMEQAVYNIFNCKEEAIAYNKLARRCLTV